jgi:HEPN domain-containing protein
MKFQDHDTPLVEEDIIHQIVKLIQPERIYCQRSFLLLVLSNRIQRPLSDYRALLDSKRDSFNSLSFTLLNSLELEKFLNQGQLFYSRICNPEFLVYESGQAPVVYNLNQRIVKAVIKASSDFQPGYNRAQLFLHGAEYYLQLSEWCMAVFMLHQATEQVLRSIILAVTEQDVRTHSINELKQHLKNCGPNLQNFLSGETQHLLTILEASYSGSRYLNKYQVGRETAESLMSEVILFIDAVKKSFDDMVTSFSSLRILQPEKYEAI